MPPKWAHYRQRGLSIDERIWSRIDVVGECFLWQGERSGNGGYALLSIMGRYVRVYRYLWERAHGTIAKGCEPDHLCRQPPCINLSHIEVVSHQENIRRGLAIRTSCPHGHPYDEKNTSIHQGARRCLTCHREREGARYHAKRSAVHTTQPTRELGNTTRLV